MGEIVTGKAHRLKIGMTDGARHIGEDIMVKTTAQGDIHHLDTTTDGKKRLALLQRPTHQRYFHLIPFPVDPLYFGTDLLTIKGRVNVATASKEQAIDAIKDRAQGILFQPQRNLHRRTTTGHYTFTVERVESIKRTMRRAVRFASVDRNANEWFC